MEEDEDEEEETNTKKHKAPPKFDEGEFLKKWDEENPEIIVPGEVVDDIDNDYDIEEVEESA